jgi:FtsH Extracellular
MSDTQPPAKNRRSAERRTGPRAAPGGAVWYVLGFLVLLALAQAFFLKLQPGDTVSYSEFKALVRADKVQEVTLSDEKLYGTLKPVGTEKGKSFSAVRVVDAKLPEDLEAHQVKYTGEVDHPAPLHRRALGLLPPPHGRRRGGRDVVRAQQGEDLRRR